jgi:hypothetical protein
LRVPIFVSSTEKENALWTVQRSRPEPGIALLRRHDDVRDLRNCPGHVENVSGGPPDLPAVRLALESWPRGPRASQLPWSWTNLQAWQSWTFWQNCCLLWLASLLKRRPVFFELSIFNLYPA